ncbi:hypothetical protein HYT92_03265 [Candidatus Pacearchaeota archaeon]|nr:hypothetical protein [Candidatus Pacearchaeota archaeon]
MARVKALKDNAQSGSKAYVSKDGYDLCVICRSKTEYKTETPVDVRVGYIGDGGGQACRSCHNKLYQMTL